jgi:hypothetical protein
MTPPTMAALDAVRVALPNGWSLVRNADGGWAWAFLAPPKPQALARTDVLYLRTRSIQFTKA